MFGHNKIGEFWVKKRYIEIVDNLAVLDRLLLLPKINF